MLPVLAILCANTTQVQFREGLAKDLEVLRSAYTKLHPGLYRYSTPRQVEAHFRLLGQRFAKANTLADAFVDLSLFTASVRCGHTYPNFFNQTEAVVDQLFSGQNRIPCHFRWLGGKMVVTHDCTPNHQLPPGTQIESIDGISASSIRDKMMGIARADGSNNAKRLSILEVDGKSKFEAFDIYLPLLFKIPNGSFTLGVRDGMNRSATVRVNALSKSDRLKDSQDQEQSSGAEGGKWRFEWKTPQVGLLTMPTFVTFDTKWDWSAYLDGVFEQLSSRTAKALIIDLRGNEGGSSIGDQLCAYFLDRPANFDQYHLYTRYTKLPPELRPYLETWDRSFDDWSPWSEPPKWMAPGRNEFHRMKRWDNADQILIKPRSPHFGGKLLVLVDSSNSSATFEFDNMIQTHHLGILVGQPTGGNSRGINGSAFYFLYLPNSKLEVDLPLVAQFPSTPMPDAGLSPDVTVQTTAAGLAAGRDEVLDKALSLTEPRS